MDFQILSRHPCYVNGAMILSKMDKQVLREVYKRQRLSMSRAEVQSKSRIICQKLLAQTDWTAMKTACVYSPIAKLNEVDVSGLAKIMQKHGVKVLRLSPLRDLRIPAGKFDLILVPCLAFGKDNYRLGWGGGFYDKFLATQPQALKIGVCFENGFVPGSLPIEAHDVKLDVIITEEKAYR